jgi:hypothetical protein
VHLNDKPTTGGVDPQEPQEHPETDFPEIVVPGFLYNKILRTTLSGFFQHLLHQPYKCRAAGFWYAIVDYDHRRWILV